MEEIARHGISLARCQKSTGQGPEWTQKWSRMNQKMVQNEPVVESLNFTRHWRTITGGSMPGLQESDEKTQQCKVVDDIKTPLLLVGHFKVLNMSRASLCAWFNGHHMRKNAELETFTGSLNFKTCWRSSEQRRDDDVITPIFNRSSRVLYGQYSALPALAGSIKC